MNRIKNLSRAGWMIVGAVVALLLVPTGVALALTYTGIQGTSGNEADVVPGGQLLTAENNPNDSFASLETNANGNHQPPAVNVTSSTCQPFGDMNLGVSQTALVTSVQISVYSPPSPAGAIYVYNDDNCGGAAIVNDSVPSTISGTQNITFPTPVPVWGPDGYSEGGSGDYLSASEVGGVSASVIVDGYATESQIKGSTPSAPISLTAAPGTGCQVLLNWKAPSSNGGSPIINYDIYRGLSPGGENVVTPIAVVSGTTDTYTDTSLSNSSSEYYVVEAVNALGNSARSNEASATPAFCGPN